MGKVINGIAYVDRSESTATLVRIPVVGQTPLAESQASIDARNYRLSTRNAANAYIIPTNEDLVYLNFIPQKVFIEDSQIQTILAPEFTYFVQEPLPVPEPFRLLDGQIFRCVDGNSVPLNKENYVYYIMIDGVGKRIPDYKTLEVMLAERNQTLLSVRVLEGSLCSDIPKDTQEISSKSDQWTEDFKDATSIEALKGLENKAASAKAIADGAKAQADQQIAAVKAQAEQSKAEADAAKAKSQADAAAAQAAIAQADAAKAAAEQAKAEADAQKAALEAEKTK